MSMKVALVHDYLSQDGGAERVLKALQELYPEAPTFVLFYDKSKLPEHYFRGEVRNTFLQYLPGIKSHYRWYLPLMPHATECHDLADYDVVISSSSAFAKGVLTAPGTMHVSYCHTPTRYLWTDTHSYLEEIKSNWLVKRLLLPVLISRLRVWDQLAAGRVDFFIANSETVRGRIQKYYRRDATVVFPPVDTSQYGISQEFGDYFLTGGRLVYYKRFDLVVRAFNRLGIKLKVFGSGPEEGKLREMANANIEFTGQVTDAEKARLYSQALAFINPQVEDFGITAVESMAAGRPVLAFAAGGALETVRDGITGSFFNEQSWNAILDKVLRFDPAMFDPQKIREQALVYDAANFKKQIAEFVLGHYLDFKKTGGKLV